MHRDTAQTHWVKITKETCQWTNKHDTKKHSDCTNPKTKQQINKQTTELHNLHVGGDNNLWQMGPDQSRVCLALQATVKRRLHSFTNSQFARWNDNFDSCRRHWQVDSKHNARKPSIENLGQIDRITMPTHVGLRHRQWPQPHILLC